MTNFWSSVEQRQVRRVLANLAAPAATVLRTRGGADRAPTRTFTLHLDTDATKRRALLSGRPLRPFERAVIPPGRSARRARPACRRARRPHGRALAQPSA